MRVLIRVLSCVVIVSAAITAWTRAALVFVLGPQLTRACLWVAVGGSLCAALTLARTRKPGRRQRRRPLDPPADQAVPDDSDPAAVRPGRPGHRTAGPGPGTSRGMQAAGRGRAGRG